MEKKTYISNFVKFEQVADEGVKIKVVKDESGNELGFEVRGILTTFDVKNVNDYVFTRQSYDKFVDEYFVKNKINVPLCLQHRDDDPRCLCGIVKDMKKTDHGVEIVGFVFRSAYYYGMIKDQIERGLYQGFSNSGYVIDYEYDNENNALIINEFELMHVAIVCTPGDVSAKLSVKNTVFSGFENKEEKKEMDAYDIMTMA